MSEDLYAFVQCKKMVYLHRIRLKPLFLDFDKLRTGKVYENQFLSALAQGGLHKLLSARQLEALASKYKYLDFQGNKGHTLWKVDYEAFLSEIEKVFGEKGLEKDPLKEVEAEPSQLLDRLRYRRTTKQLDPQKEKNVQELLERLQVDSKIMGTQVKEAFYDAAHAPTLSKIVNHVTTSQFFQGLCKLNLGISALEANLLAEKFGHPEHADLVNYALFSTVANPTKATMMAGTAKEATGTSASQLPAQPVPPL